MAVRTIIQTEAGEATHVKGLSPEDIEPKLAVAIRRAIPFVYIEGEGKPPKSVCVAPQHVTALIRVEY